MITGLVDVAAILLLILTGLLCLLIVALYTLRGLRPLRDRRRDAQRTAATQLLLRLVLGEEQESSAARAELGSLSGAAGREFDRQALDFLTKLRGEPLDVLRGVVVARGGLRHASSLCRSRWTVRRCRGAYQLALLAAPEAAPTLMDLLADRRAAVRRLAVRALGASGSQASVGPLLDAAENRRALRPDVVAALVQLGPAAVPTLREQVAAAVRDAERPVLEVAGHRSSGSAQVAARALGILGDVGASGLLSRAVTCGDVALATEAAFSLGELGTASAVPALVDALDRPGSVREEAVSALGKIGDPAAGDALAAKLDEDRLVGRSAAAALLRLGAAGEALLRSSSSDYAREALAVASVRGLRGHHP